MDSKFSIHYKKAKKIDLDKFAGIAKMQSYIPIYKRFFDMDDSNYNKICLNNKYQICDLNTVYDCTNNNAVVEKPIFVKFSPLLDPLNFLRGKYNLESPITRALPQLNTTAESCLPKLLDTNNTAYVDGFFSYLTSMVKETHGWIHGVEYYGSFLAIQEKFKYNIADDLEFVMECPFFNNNIGKYFTIDEEASAILNQHSGEGSRANRNKLCIQDADAVQLDVSLDFEDLSTSLEIQDIQSAGLELEYENPVGQTTQMSADSSDSSSESDTSESNSESDTSESDSNDDDDESVWETESESESDNSIFQDEDEQMFSYLKDYPVQMIFQEKCTGTLDQLLMNRKLTDDQIIDALMQIILTLTAYQKMFDFTHNDLHTNNIMFIETDVEFLYYKVDDIVYKVPTNGRIFKLIDFGRAIYKFGGKLFCSDSFAPSGDASTQYNCEPYFNEKKPRIDPNPSFDLCRLGCSMFDFVCRSKEPKTPLQKIVDSWCNDDFGKNMLYKPSGQCRYPDFKLYKMIARTVNNLVPKDQLKTLVFSSRYKFDGESTNLMDIDALPAY
jgi:hypothetical protein